MLPPLTGELLTDFPEIDLQAGSQLVILYATGEADAKGQVQLIPPILEATGALSRKVRTSAEDRYRAAIAGGVFKANSYFVTATDVEQIKDLVLKGMMIDLAQMLIESGVDSGTLKDLAAGLARKV